MPSRKGKKKGSNKGGRKKASSQASPRSQPAPSNKAPVAPPEIVRVVNADGSVTIESEPFVPLPTQDASPFQDYDNQAIEIESETFEAPAPEAQLFMLDPDATYIESEPYTPPLPVPTPTADAQSDQDNKAIEIVSEPYVPPEPEAQTPEPPNDTANDAIFIQSEEYSPPTPPLPPAVDDELDDAIFIESEPSPAFNKLFQHADATPVETERETTETAEKEKPAVTQVATELSSVVTHFLLPAAAVVVGALAVYKLTSRKRS